MPTNPNAPPGTPTISFADAIRAYQQKNPIANAQAYQGLFPYLQQQGFQVERPTHAGGTLPSDDKVVNSATGEVFDLILGVDGPNPSWNSGLNVAGYWVNGKPSATPPGGGTVLGTGVGGAIGTGREKPPGAETIGTAVPRGTALGGNAGDTYGAAYLAMQLQRKKAQASGRKTTILGGFAPATPTTRPATALGAAA